MADVHLFEGLPRDVAAQISSHLECRDLRRLVCVSRAVRHSLFWEKWLKSVRLVVPPNDSLAHRLLNRLDATATASITNVALADASHIQNVSAKLRSSVASLRVSGDGYLVSSYEPIMALTYLDQFSKLRCLDLSGSKILGVSSLAGLTQLIELDLSLTVVVDLSPLESLTKLEVLNLERTRVKSIKAVRSMPALRVLNLNGTKSLTKLAPLRSLTKLTTLSINDIVLTELASLLAVAPTLTSLDAIDVTFLGPHVRPLERQEALSSLVHLQQLRTWPISWTQSLEPLGPLTHLTTLDIRFPPFSDLAPLQLLPNLADLRLMVSAARDTSPLCTLKKLRKLVLTGCTHDPHALDFLDHLPQLHELSLSGEIHASVVARLGRVHTLELVFSSASWDALPHDRRPSPSIWKALTSVKHLSLRFPVGEPADLSGLSCLKQLEELDLRYATPRELPTPAYFDFLLSLRHLRTLRLAYGGMEDLRVLQNLTKLEFLDLTSTNVSDIEPLASLHNLQQIELAYTRVADISSLVRLQHLTRIALPAEASCLPLVRANLPQLCFILHEHNNCLWNSEHHRTLEERERGNEAVAVPIGSEALEDLVVAFGEYTGDY